MEKHQDFIWELKNLWKMKIRVASLIIDAFGTVPKMIESRLDELEIQGRKYCDCPDYETVGVCKDTEKIVTDLQKLAVTVSGSKHQISRVNTEIHEEIEVEVEKNKYIK